MTTTPWTREGESFLAVRDLDPGNCTACGQPLIEGWFCWDNWLQDPADPFPNTGRFPALRHADGSPNHGRFDPDTKNRCPECRGEQLSYEDTGYGTIARCPCGWNKYTDRGD